MTGRRIRALALAAVVLAAAVIPTTAAAATPRTSLTAIWNDVMCVSCHEPLAVAQSPQAIYERNYIRRLVDQGETKAQIEQALVAQYGPAVLGKPPAHGINLLVYLLPPAILVLGVVTLVITLPRWRRRTRAAAATSSGTSPPALAPADERRLQDELSRYPG